GTKYSFPGTGQNGLDQPSNPSNSSSPRSPESYRYESPDAPHPIFAVRLPRNSCKVRGIVKQAQIRLGQGVPSLASCWARNYPIVVNLAFLLKLASSDPPASHRLC